MVSVEDIHPLSDFVRNTKSLVRRLGKTGRPEILTVNGRASVVVQDAAAYAKLVEELERSRTHAALEAAKRGEGMPVKEAFALIRKRAAERRKK